MMKFIVLLYFLLPYIAADDIDITTSSLKGQRILEIDWCGEGYNYAFIRTNKGSVYRSEDKGKSFSSITKRLVEQGQDTTQYDDIGLANDMIVSASDNSSLVIIGTLGVNWITDNCGRTWKVIDTKEPVKDVKFHPFNKKLLLASTNGKNCTKVKSSKMANEDDDDIDNDEDDNDNVVCKVTSTLFLSKDGGSTYEIIYKDVLKYDWVSSDIKMPFPETRIIIVTRDSKGKRMIKISDDYFKSTIINSESSFEYTITSSLFFIADITNEKTQELMLKVSPLVKTLEFKKIKVPDKKLKHHGYSIIDTNFGGVFLLILHGRTHEYGTLYKSDKSGREYVQSLKNVVVENGIKPIITKIDGLESTLIANVFTEEAIKMLKSKNAQSISGPDSWKTITKKSVITYNLGGNWKSLKAPTSDFNGEKLNCDQDDGCSLHFVTGNDLYYSKNAVGIIVGYGNTGSYIQSDFQLPSTFYSRDGGYTWKMLSKYMLDLTTGDHGGLIMAINDTEAIFSWNEGKSWNTINLESYLNYSSKANKDKVVHSHISRLETTPEEVSLRFLGFAYNEDFEKLLIISFNFEGYHEPKCAGADAPGSSDSNYENWIPYQGKFGNECILGRKVSYVRRKQDAECFNGDTFSRSISAENCICTEEDYECDFGYTRKSIGGVCELESRYNISLTDDCYNGEKYYTISNGYRKIAGDSCQGGVAHTSRIITCSRFSLTYSTISIIVIMIIIIICLLMLDYQKMVACITNCWKNRGDYINLNKKQTVDIGDGEIVAPADLNEIVSGESDEKEDRSRVGKTAKIVPPLSKP